jgi:hypothetical protein
MKKSEYNDWIDMDTTPPTIDQKIMYWFEYTGVSVGYYDGKHEDYGWNMVHGNSGFLAEDGMLWRPLTDEEFERLETRISAVKEFLRDLNNITN